MSGYIDCACRDCLDIAIGEAGAFCSGCEEAGCQDNPKVGTCMLCDDDGYIGRADDLTGGEPCEVCGPGRHECLREDAYEADDVPPECPACEGPGVLLGGLGRLIHFRCRNCGMDFNREAA